MNALRTCNINVRKLYVPSTGKIPVALSISTMVRTSGQSVEHWDALTAKLYGRPKLTIAEGDVPAEIDRKKDVSKV